MSSNVEATPQEVDNLSLAVALAAMVGVLELVKELDSPTGPVAKARIRNLMVDRFRSVPLPEQLQKPILHEIDQRLPIQ